MSAVNFTKNFSNVPGNTPAASLQTSVTSLPANLIQRRVYAHVAQSAGVPSVCTFTLTFKRSGVSLGTIQQRIAAGSYSSPVDSYLYSFGAPIQHGYTAPGAGAVSMSPGALFIAGGDSVSGIMFWSGINPIELLIECDEIALACSEWTSYDTSNRIHLYLACLSTERLTI